MCVSNYVLVLTYLQPLSRAAAEMNKTTKTM